MTQEKLHKQLEELVKLPKECEWVEFKHNHSSPEEIGERISALSNGACLHNQSFGYLVFGVEDGTHTPVGTTFKPKMTKKGNEELEHWLAQRLNPRIDFRIYEFDYQSKHFALFEIPSATGHPVRFSHIAYIRVGGITRSLNDFPEKEKKIWSKTSAISFEDEIAVKNISADEVVKLLDCQGFFDLMKIPFPSTRQAILEKLISEGLIKTENGKYHITNLCGILFTKDLKYFETLSRKAARVIVYGGINRVKTIREQQGCKGYAVGFGGLINFINTQLPSNEEIGKAFRETVRVYPELAIRELVANALIHQDFSERGTAPMIEIFSDRIEITNPGIPLIKTIRFIDEYQSRNEKLASFMRRVGICEEKGSGIDKVIFQVELYQLPAPAFEDMEKHTKIYLYAPKKFKEMDRKDRIRACYQHCCLKYVSNEKMTNTSLRERFKIDIRNSPMVSKVISETMKEGLIKYDDPTSASRKYARYIPFWA